MLLYRQYNCSALEAKKIKNIVIPEIPTIEDVIIEVLQHYKPTPQEGIRTENIKINHQLKATSD